MGYTTIANVAGMFPTFVRGAARLRPDRTYGGPDPGAAFPRRREHLRDDQSLRRGGPARADARDFRRLERRHTPEDLRRQLPAPEKRPRRARLAEPPARERPL